MSPLIQKTLLAFCKKSCLKSRFITFLTFIESYKSHIFIFCVLFLHYSQRITKRTEKVVLSNSTLKVLLKLFWIINMKL